MKLKLYCVKDVVTNDYGNPMPFVNEASAIRYFENLCKESKIGGDLQLFYVCDFNRETGAITIEDNCILPVYVVGGKYE